MKTQLTKRILGIVLCLAMLMTYMPTVILAAEGDVASVTTAEGTQTYADLASAFAAAAQAENSVLTLLADTATSNVYVDGGKFTVDLNGKTWTANSRALVIVGADMLITDSTADGQGKIVGTSGDIIMLGDGTKLEIAGGTVENTADFCVDTQNNGNPTDAQFTLSGGKLVTAGWAAIKVGCASVTIKGGKIDRPVRGATLIGRGTDVLTKIDRVGKKMWMAQGMCGAGSGSVPTNVGQPMIRLTGITVGGR